MPNDTTAHEAAHATLSALRGTLIHFVRQPETPDLTARQITVLLTVYLSAEKQTVRGLAKHLNVSKPAITRALDRLSEVAFLSRKTDPADRRSVFVQKTAKGHAFLQQYRSVLEKQLTTHLPSNAPGGEADVLTALRGTFLHFVSQPLIQDLTARQLAVLLTVDIREEKQTVRGLALELNVSKPAITRALDRLGNLNLAIRMPDPTDRRSILIQETQEGAGLIQMYRRVFETELAALRAVPEAANDSARGGHSTRSTAAAGPQRD